MPTIEELEARIKTLEGNYLKLSRKVFGDTVAEVKIGVVYKCSPGERVATGGYIDGIEHKQDKNGKPWQSFKLAGSDGKGVYAKHFGEWPTWAAQGIACVVEELEVGSYNSKNTYTVRKWRAYGQNAKPKAYAEPAMQAQAPLDMGGQTFQGDDPPWVDDTPRKPQTFVSDEEAGVDPSTIKF